MSKYSFSLLFFLLSFVLTAQDKKEVKKTDSIIPKTQRYGLRLGLDLSKLARSVYEKDYRGLEIVGDYRLTKKIYIAAEIGNEKKKTEDTALDFTTTGTYFKVGFDSNSYENWLDMENMIHIGLRYGVSSFSQELNNYTVYNTNSYFPLNPVTVANKKFDGLSAQWAEIVAGAKAEIFNNLYLGFSVRMNYLVVNNKPEGFDNLYIPGFNRTYDGKFGVGWNYTVSYFIPLYKKTSKKEAPIKLDSKGQK
jgi:Domain of unknown function (DUF6048)